MEVQNTAKTSTETPETAQNLARKRVIIQAEGVLYNLKTGYLEALHALLHLPGGVITDQDLSITTEEAADYLKEPETLLQKFKEILEKKVKSANADALDGQEGAESATEELESQVKLVFSLAQEKVLCFESTMTAEHFKQLEDSFDLTVCFTSLNLLNLLLVSHSAENHLGAKSANFQHWSALEQSLAPPTTPNLSNLYLVFNNIAPFTDFLKSAETEFSGFRDHHSIQSIHIQTPFEELMLKMRAAKSPKNQVFNNLRCLSQIKPKIDILSYLEANPEARSKLFKVAYRVNPGKNTIVRHNIFYDEYPFIFNQIAVFEGERVDYDAVFQKVKRQDDLNRMVDLLEAQWARGGDGAENGGRESLGGGGSGIRREAFLNLPHSRLKVLDRWEVQKSIEKVIGRYNEEDPDRDFNWRFPTSVVVDGDESDEVSTKNSKFG